jgi:ActR/RegA family two-component response regulator
MTETLDDRTPKPSILLVDDDERFRSRMARAFEERGYEAQQAEGYDGAIEIAEHESTEYAVVDLRMPGKSGLEVVRELHRIDPATKIVVLTGYGSIATALEAVRLGATHYLHHSIEVTPKRPWTVRLRKAGPPKPHPWPESSGSTSNESSPTAGATSPRPRKN